MVRVWDIKSQHNVVTFPAHQVSTRRVNNRRTLDTAQRGPHVGAPLQTADPRSRRSLVRPDMQHGFVLV
jgi:hypothetical protein